MLKDRSNIVSQSDSRIPTIAESEKIIQAEAPTAVKTLNRWGAIDCAEALGLSPYTESDK